MTTVDQLMFAAINVWVSANHSISPAINVPDYGSCVIGYSNCKKCVRGINVRIFDQTAKSANINSTQTFPDVQ